MRRWHEDNDAASMRRAITKQQRSEEGVPFSNEDAGMPGFGPEDFPGKRHVAAGGCTHLNSSRCSHVVCLKLPVRPNTSKHVFWTVS
jgi:hypothetical protein